MAATWTRKMALVLAAGTLALAWSASAAAQDAAKSPAQASSQDQNAQPDNSAQPGQSNSLGDLARALRAKKQNEPKPGKIVVIDDDNMPRTGTGISVVGSAAGGSPDSTGRGSSGSARFVLLDFWASWCGPCRQSVPDLKQLQQTFSGDQLQVISIDEDKNENAGRNFASQNGMNWEVQFDPGGETSRQHGVNAFPTFILMDSNGREVQRFVGEDSSESLASRIAPYMRPAPKGIS